MRRLLIPLFCTLIFCQSCALLTAAGISSQGQPIKEVPEPLTSLQSTDPKIDHSPWTALLQKYVDEQGFVDYKGFKADQEALQAYLTTLSENPPTEEWAVQELLAYYINLYNAYTVDLIVKNYPVKSIKDIGGAWTKAIVPVGDRTMSLGGIENGVLRKMNEPRIHFAINCASISCPKLQNEAYTAANIDEQLDKAAKEFINSNKNDITEESPKLSKIFKWYEKDYVINGINSVGAYINRYATTKINTGAALNYIEYDWNLNEQQ
ncbi:DUF547 domain-containing protein [Aquimarina brevivitae]|uniref:Uncharacterized protein DUF547 n=1 Tax=Aquimarina brevivitae TaxID=323412 RepID=A0A4Q7PLD4_9FLAO|nr:DUF547 domain-containing protein [Aquimarina brevivitae]RZS99772.1 uncharacterized protein DUF547 [Aquimarina brevivitae]